MHSRLHGAPLPIAHVVPFLVIAACIVCGTALGSSYAALPADVTVSAPQALLTVVLPAIPAGGQVLLSSDGRFYPSGAAVPSLWIAVNAVAYCR